MKRISGLVGVVVIGVAMLTGCAGGLGGAPKTASSGAAPIEELKAIPKDLDAEVAGLTKPLDDLQAIIDDVAALPTKYGVKVKDLRAMIKVAIEGGTMEFSGTSNLSVEAQAEVDAKLARLSEIVAEIKATPAKVAALGKHVVASTAKMPVLAAQAVTTAKLTASNPFGSAAAKAQAQADLDSLGEIRQDVTHSLTEAQAKLTELPAKATGALGKLSTSFTNLKPGKGKGTGTAKAAGKKAVDSAS